jgi:type I restriction enzyme M protein
MANLIFRPIADQITSGTYLLYDAAIGTGGMLTVAEQTLQEFAVQSGKKVTTHLYGQEINAETYAICKSDLLLSGEGSEADNVIGGPEWSTLSNDAFPNMKFDFMLSNPPYGKSWKTDLEKMSGGSKKKTDISDHRFIVSHKEEPELSLLTRSSDGQMLFLANMVSKMKHDTELGSRIAEIHNVFAVKGSRDPCLPSHIYQPAKISTPRANGFCAIHRCRLAPCPSIKRLKKSAVWPRISLGKFSATL